jgi:hypothetical protein
MLISMMFYGAVMGNTKSKGILLDAEYSSYGGLSDKNKHVYVRVFADGKVEYEKEVNGKFPLKFEMANSQLSDSQLAELKSFLESNTVKVLGKSYSINNRAIDYFRNLDIKISTNGAKQTVKLVNFKGEFSKADEYYSQIKDLVCAIENLRKDSNYSILDHPAEFCNK